MKVVESNKNKLNEIEIGDIFKSEDSGEYYILARTKDGFGSISLGGNKGWNYYYNLPQAKECLHSNVEEGQLIHYSKNNYHLSLEEM